MRPPKQSHPRIEKEETDECVVEVIPDTDLNMRDVRPFVVGEDGKPQETREYILKPLPHWTLSLGAFG